MSDPIWRRVLIHHSATVGNTERSWDAIRDFHVKERGWQDIGYHFGVGMDTTLGLWSIFPGRPLTMQGAHCPGQNREAIGVCFLGNFMLEEPSSSQLEAGADLITRLLHEWRIPSYSVYPHKKYRQTECPGDKFPMERLRSLVQTIEAFG